MLLKMFWGHSNALTGLTEEILGPYKIISHFCEEINEHL
jgi:hypothetical protein